MTTIVSATGTARPTVHGKRQIAQFMYAKGANFLGAAMLLRRNRGDEFVVLHLLCMGIEIMLKGLLLTIDYDKHRRSLKEHFGHNLVRLADAASIAAGLRPLQPKVREELEALNGLYSRHLLRYASGYDMLVDPRTIARDRVLRRMVALMHLIERRKLMHPATN